MLRSKSPELARQEIWGYLCCHYAIQVLMVDAAEAGGRDPDRVSFVAALRIVRRSIAHRGDFPPHDHDRLWKHAIGVLLRRLNPKRRRRSNPASSSGRCPDGTSNESTTPTGHSPSRHLRRGPTGDNRSPRGADGGR